MMGRWLDRFRSLKNNGIDRLTPGTPVDTFDASDTRAPDHVSKVSQGVPGVSPSIPLKNVLEAPSVGPNGSHSSAFLSSIEAADAAEYDAALTVFCDFETRNTGGCDLKTAGAWRYAADPATEILCFGYRIDGVDYSWAPTMGSRDLG
jgi:hypothetical protein